MAQALFRELGRSVDCLQAVVEVMEVLACYSQILVAGIFEVTSTAID
jgi:hypothetical protein